MLQSIHCVLTADGRVIRNVKECRVHLNVSGERFHLTCLVMPILVNGFKVIIGMNVIKKFQSLLLRGVDVLFYCTRRGT